MLVGIGATFVPLMLSEPIGRLAAICTPDLGCTAALFYLGAASGIVVALVVRTWRDLGWAVAGLWLGGVAYGLLLASAAGVTDPIVLLPGVLFSVPVGASIFLGFLGLPLFAIVVMIRWAIGRFTRSAP